MSFGRLIEPDPAACTRCGIQHSQGACVGDATSEATATHGCSQTHSICITLLGMLELACAINCLHLVGCSC